MSRYFQRLRSRFCDVADEAIAFLQRSGDVPRASLGVETQSESDPIRARLRKFVVPVYRCMSASRLLHARDYRDFATLVREMDAALDFRKLRGRWNDERLQPFEAEYRFREAYRRVLELLDFVPREVGDDPKRASPICIHKQLPSVGTFDHTSTFEQTGRE